ncbi:hypothetical protein [Halobacteriovorax sp. JY17]|uniref:hypothetical protein n=1 Tax=Halobacteriovorax sp. JY17 TaxID=2014617 RepID=UPI000C479801|nr:hypothetical protein [Halobacteriovorax sp. JY17]PIK15988.1 MAG: hypothetical protein CES88_04465 [Halobacteriovorax sp. JY17]
MKKIILIPILLLLSVSAMALECTGERREIIGHDVHVVKEKLIDQNYPTVTKLELDIDDAYFSAQVEGDDVLAIISLGPDYTNGNLSRSSFNSYGTLKLSYVSPTKTLILECKK